MDISPKKLFTTLIKFARMKNLCAVIRVTVMTPCIFSCLISQELRVMGHLGSGDQGSKS